MSDRQMVLAKRFHAADLIGDAMLARIEAAYQPAGTTKYEMREEGLPT